MSSDYLDVEVGGAYGETPAGVADKIRDDANKLLDAQGVTFTLEEINLIRTELARACTAILWADHPSDVALRTVRGVLDLVNAKRVGAR